MCDLLLNYRACGAECRDDYLREVANENSLPLECVARKHAVIGLTRVAALKHARDGIRVNAIMAGTTLTNLVKGVMDLGPDVRQALENSSPMGQLARPEEIAEAALWLCSDRASFVTGHAPAVDGGYLAQ